MSKLSTLNRSIVGPCGNVESYDLALCRGMSYQVCRLSDWGGHQVGCLGVGKFFIKTLT